MNQEPYRGFQVADQEFADNPDPRCPCVLLLDTSHSMAGSSIAELNTGLQQYREELLADNLAARRVEIALMRFGGSVELECDFVTAREYVAPTLRANGDTPMSEAVVRGIKLLEDRKTTYAANGIAHYRPWIFLITDGGPTDGEAKWRVACEAVRLGEQQKKFIFFAVGTSDANFDTLRELSPAREPLRLKGVAFREFFRWLSNSQTRVSQSQVGTHIALPSPTAPGGWAEVPT